MTGTTVGNSRARRIPILLAATLSVALLIGGTFPTTASAITRKQVIARGMHWVKARIPYNQRRYHQGYRTDCSGFVSMAWSVKRSYTTWNIHRVSRKIGKGSLRPGDAVLMPGKGHVVLFQKWANRSHTRYVALEEPGRRVGHTVKRVRTWRRGSTALRRVGIRDGVRRVAVAPRAVTPKPAAPVAIVAPTPSVPTVATPTAMTASSRIVTATVAAPILP